MVVHIYKNDKRADQTHGRFHEAEEALAKKNNGTKLPQGEFRECSNFFFSVCGDCLVLTGCLQKL